MKGGGGRGNRRKRTREEENLPGERVLKGGVQLVGQCRPRVSDKEGALHPARLAVRESPVLPGNEKRDGRGTELGTEGQWAERVRQVPPPSPLPQVPSPSHTSLPPYPSLKKCRRFPISAMASKKFTLHISSAGLKVTVGGSEGPAVGGPVGPAAGGPVGPVVGRSEGRVVGGPVGQPVG